MENKSFLKIQNNGVVLFTHADKFKLYIIYNDVADNKFYHFTLDKYFIIEAVAELNVGDVFPLHTYVHWYQPKLSENGSYFYKGIIHVDNEFRNFEINDNGVMHVGECPENINGEYGDGKHDKITKYLGIDTDVLPTVRFENMSTKGDKIYLLGLDTKYNEQVFIAYDRTQGNIVRKYHLNSGLGDIRALTVNADPSDDRVYVGGAIDVYDDEDNFLYSTPYVETFLMA